VTWVTPGVGRAPRRRGSDQFAALAANNDPGIVCLSDFRQPTIRPLLKRADTEALVGNYAIHVVRLSPGLFLTRAFASQLIEICIGLEINGYLPAEF
jgi:hypothetical protein